MGKFITTNRLKKIIENRPEGVQPEEILNELVSAGHEIEGFNTQFTPLEVVKNAPGSFLEFGKNIWKAVTSPKQTAEALADITTGGILKLLPDEWVNEKGKKFENKFDAAVDFFQDRYGLFAKNEQGQRVLIQFDRLAETIERDPFGFLSDIATFGSLGTTLISKAGKVAKLTKIAKTANRVRQVARKLDPVNIATDFVPKMTLKSVKAVNRSTRVGKWLEMKGREKAIKGFGLPENDTYKRLRKHYGKDLEQVMSEIGIFGDPDQVLAQARNIKNQTRAVVDNALSKIDTKVKSPSVDKLLKTIDRSLPKLQSKDLIKLRSQIRLAIPKHAKEGLTLTDINEIRRSFDDLISSKVFTQGGKVKQNIRAADLKKLSGEVRSLLYRKAADNGFTDLRDLNHQTMLGKFVEENIPSLRKQLKDRTSRLEANTIGEFFFKNPFQNTVKSMQFRTTLANRLMMLSGKDLQILKAGVSAGRPNARARGIIRRIFNDLKPVYPELRLAGVIEKEVSKMTLKELDEKRQENVLGALETRFRDKINQSGLRPPRSFITGISQ